MYSVFNYTGGAYNGTDDYEYDLFKIQNGNNGYNSGIALTSDSISSKLKISDLGKVSDYDSRL